MNSIKLVWLPDTALNNAYVRAEKTETFKGKMTRFCFIHNASFIHWTTILYHYF